MVMLSQLRRFRLHDGHQHARLLDLAVDLSAQDYPPVTRVFLHAQRGQKRVLPWSEVTSIDWSHERFEVTDLSRAKPVDAQSRERDRTVLLHADILDALILDLANRHSVRANDLWLEQHDNRLELRATDVGAWAILRRIGRGLLGRGSGEHLLDWRDVEFLRGDPQAARAGHDYHRRVARLQPSEIARLLDAVPYLHAAELVMLIPEPVAADTLEVMRPERQVQVFEELDHHQRVRLLELMAPNNAADLLGRLGPPAAKECLEALSAHYRGLVLELMRYPPNTAGGIMTNHLIVVEARLTIRQARAAIRDALKEPDFVYYVYVIDDPKSRQLQGVLTLRDLLVADENDPVERVMQPRIETLDPDMSANSAARHVADQHLAALPVVKDGRLLGVVTSDAALLQIAPPSMSGAEPRVFT